MSENTVKARLRHAVKPEATWTSENPVLKEGEVGYVKETGRYKVGDGKTAWNSLAWGQPSSHTHDDRYYTETEIDTKLKTKSDTGHTHNYAGSSTPSGVANSAAKLATARTINGTSFDGSGNITTANWGTSRNITIGNTKKAVNGGGDISWNLTEIGASAANHTHSYLPLSGGTLTGDLKLANSYVYSTTASSGTVGYQLIATLKISKNYQNAPIKFTVTRRRDATPTAISVTFKSVNSSDPELESLQVWGTTAEVWINKSATSTWDLYVQKTEAYDIVEVIEYHKPPYDSGISVTFSEVVVSTVPTSAIQASWGCKVGYAASAGSVSWRDISGRPTTFSPVSHTHTKSQITDFPASLKNPTSLILRLNGGTTEGTNQFTYDGSAAKTVSITPAGIGAATSGHTHDLSTMINTLSTASSTPVDADYYICQYAGGGTSTTTYHRRSMSALWNYIKGKGDATYLGKTATAATATKLATARTVSASTDFYMSFSYDGSANSTASLGYYSCSSAVGNTNNYPYHRFAKLDVIKSSHIDKSSTFLITQDYDGGGWGIVRIVLRTNDANTKSAVKVQWLCRVGLAVDFVQVGIYNVAGSTYADAFFKHSGTYNSTVARNLASGSRGTVERTWALTNSSEVSNTTTSDKKTSTEVYATIAAAGTALHSQAYSTIVAGSDGGIVSYANSADSSTKATQDSAGQQINTTYIKSLSVSGKTITYTKGDNTTGTITTQDTNTTYSTGTASTAGLTKLYTSTGTSTDGTMTRKAITDALSGKAASNHNHDGDYVPLEKGTVTVSSDMGAYIDLQDTNGGLGTHLQMSVKGASKWDLAANSNGELSLTYITSAGSNCLYAMNASGINMYQSVTVRPSPLATTANSMMVKVSTAGLQNFAGRTISLYASGSDNNYAGIYDHDNGWILYCDTDKVVHIPKELSTTSVTVSGNLQWRNSSGTAYVIAGTLSNDSYKNMTRIGNLTYETGIYTKTNAWKNGSTTTYFATTSTSDQRLKEKISDMSVYEDFFCKLKPFAFKYHDGLYNARTRKPMIQWGYGAQDTVKAFEESGLDWKQEELVVVEDGELTDEEKKYATDGQMLKMNYQNMSALNTHMIQKCLSRIDDLERQLAELKKEGWYELYSKSHL